MLGFFFKKPEEEEEEKKKKKRKKPWLVYWHKTRQKYQVHFRDKGILRHLGFSQHISDASILRNEFLNKRFGPSGLYIAWMSRKRKKGAKIVEQLDLLRDQRKL